jgi:hypothetical protein
MLEHNHKIQPVETSMTVLYNQQKGRMLNTMEQYYIYIYKVTKKGKQINEQYTDKRNPIFETILKIYPND